MQQFGNLRYRQPGIPQVALTKPHTCIVQNRLITGAGPVEPMLQRARIQSQSTGNRLRAAAFAGHQVMNYLGDTRSKTLASDMLLQSQVALDNPMADGAGVDLQF